MTSVSSGDAATPMENQALRGALREAGGHLAEAGCLPTASLPARALLCLALRTDSAGRLDVAAIVLEELRHHLTLSAAVAEAVRTALHEAVTNAVVHGNLGVPSSLRDSLEGLGRFHAQVEARLALPDLAQRPVLVVVVQDRPDQLRIEVSDAGAGFAFAALPDAFPPLAQPHGRGLALIRALTSACNWSPATNTLSMLFPLPAEAA